VIKIILGILAGLAVGAAVTWMLLKHHEPEEQPQEAHETEPRVLHTNGQTFVKLDKAARQHAGLKTAPLEGASLKPEVKAYGHVLDPTPLATQIVQIATARAALESSTKEFDRLKILHAQDQNVSTRALEQAEAAVQRDRIALDAAQLQLVAGWGRSIASQPDLPGFVQSLATQDSALVRVDLPLGQALQATPNAARLAALTAPDSPLEAQWLGPAATADPQTQGQGFLCLLRGNPLPPGVAVVAWLSTAGEEASGVIVPRSAIVRHAGAAFVYVQVSDELFVRQEIKLDHPLERGWFVEGGVKPGEKAVILGAQQLLSEELKGQGGEE
jgi:hypothetical protein